VLKLLYLLGILTAPFSKHSLGLQNAQSFLQDPAISCIVENLKRWGEDVLYTQLTQDLLPLIDECSKLRERTKQLSAQLKAHGAWLAYIEGFFKKLSIDKQQPSVIHAFLQGNPSKMPAINLLPSTWQEWFLLIGVSVLLAIGLVHIPFGLDLNRAIQGCLKGQPIIVVKTTMAMLLALVVAVITKHFLVTGLSHKDKGQGRLTLALGLFAMTVEVAINYQGALGLFPFKSLEMFETKFTAIGISLLGGLMNFFWASISAERIKEEREHPLKQESRVLHPVSPATPPTKEPSSNFAVLQQHANSAYQGSMRARTGVNEPAGFPQDETALFQEREALRSLIASTERELRLTDITLKNILSNLYSRLGVWFFCYKVIHFFHRK
jgi:hypothetical protein